MAKNAHIGRIELESESVMHPGYPHFVMTFALALSDAAPRGAVLQMNDDNSLVAGDLTKRSYIAAENIKEGETEALVFSLGAAVTQQLLIAEDTSAAALVFKPLNADQAITLMELSPLACV